MKRLNTLWIVLVLLTGCAQLGLAPPGTPAWIFVGHFVVESVPVSSTR